MVARKSVASTTAPQLKKMNSIPSDCAIARASTVFPHPCGPSSRMFNPLSSSTCSLRETSGSSQTPSSLKFIVRTNSTSIARRSGRVAFRTATTFTMHGTPARTRGSSQSTTFGARLPSKCVARKRNLESATGFAQKVASTVEPTFNSAMSSLSAINLSRFELSTLRRPDRLLHQPRHDRAESADRVSDVFLDELDVMREALHVDRADRQLGAAYVHAVRKARHEGLEGAGRALRRGAVADHDEQLRP